MGPYPILCCSDWASLEQDLQGLPASLVSFACVIDPMAGVPESDLRLCFPDRLIPFKTHYAVDISDPLESIASAHHQRDSRRALRRMQTTRCQRPSEYAQAWVALYEDNVIGRHGVTGPAAFPAESLTAQLAVPGLVAFAAERADQVVGMQLWFLSQGRAYYHLAAYSEVGYREGASYALMWNALSHFQELGIRHVNLGGGAGVHSAGADGLAKFKSGWSNIELTAYFGGRIVDGEEYGRLSGSAAGAATGFFPAYRMPEQSAKNNVR